MSRFWNCALCSFFVLTQLGLAACDANAQGDAQVTIDDRITVDSDSWPWWRGPTHDGVAKFHDSLPTEWNATLNIKWKSPVPGRGHGSPIVIGEQVILPTCNEQAGSQSLISFDRLTGELQWKSLIHPHGAMSKNMKASSASSTAACDGERIFITFANSDSVYATATSKSGEVLWQTRICDYVVHQGYGSSPTLYQSLVIVSADNKSGGAVAALDRESGEIVWKRTRPAEPNYASPVILHVAGRDQLIMTGCNQFVSYDPLTGETLWEIEGATTECVTTTVTNGELVYSSGGYPRNHISAVRADGSGEVVWESNDRVYVPSLLIRDGFLFGVLDAGVAGCWNAATGEQQWKARLDGNFTASPVLVGDLIFATNEDGETFIWQADPNSFSQVAMNKLGEETLATPTICRGEILMRTAIWEGDQRQEYLYCISTK